MISRCVPAISLCMWKTERCGCALDILAYLLPKLEWTCELKWENSLLQALQLFSRTLLWVCIVIALSSQSVDCLVQLRIRSYYLWCLFDKGEGWVENAYLRSCVALAINEEVNLQGKKISFNFRMLLENAYFFCSFFGVSFMLYFGCLYLRMGSW